MCRQIWFRSCSLLFSKISRARRRRSMPASGERAAFSNSSIDVMLPPCESFDGIGCDPPRLAGFFGEEPTPTTVLADRLSALAEYLRCFVHGYKSPSKGDCHVVLVPLRFRTTPSAGSAQAKQLCSPCSDLQSLRREVARVRPLLALEGVDRSGHHQ